jgi:rare lipoprotein A
MKRFLLLVTLVLSAMSVQVSAADYSEGWAAYYSNVLHGRTTASGAIYDKNAMTAAHKTLPFGTRVKVTNLANGKSVTVTINDRGPFTENRHIDLSRAAAEQVDMIKAGVVPVSIEILE